MCIQWLSCVVIYCKEVQKSRGIICYGFVSERKKWCRLLKSINSVIVDLMDADKQSKGMITILWGLIFSKCLTLEYLVQVYSVPINSFFYIWLLTLSMGGVATIAFFRTRHSDRYRLERISIVNAIWLGCSALGLLLVGILFFLIPLNPYACLTGFSIILGIGCIANGIIEGKHALTFSGIGWWIGAAVLAARNNVESLSAFAILIIFLLIVPSILELRRQKIAFL